MEHAGQTSLRLGNWKFIPAGNGPKYSKLTNTEYGNDKVPQLYNLQNDPGEQNNVASENSDKLAEMRKLLGKIKESGASRIGYQP